MKMTRIFLVEIYRQKTDGSFEKLDNHERQRNGAITRKMIGSREEFEDACMIQ